MNFLPFDGTGRCSPADVFVQPVCNGAAVLAVLRFRASHSHIRLPRKNGRTRKCLTGTSLANRDAYTNPSAWSGSFTMSSKTVLHPNVLRADPDWSELQERVVPISRATTLELAARLAYEVPGNFVEFGVAKGGSTRILRRTLTELERTRTGVAKKKIYACDSFEGLRERFENAEVGAFKCEPPKIEGVEIVKGYFEDSLTPELAPRVGRVAPPPLADSTATHRQPAALRRVPGGKGVRKKST
jgi:Macrocin-O-methyltransferase (TylF)